MQCAVFGQHISVISHDFHAVQGAEPRAETLMKCVQSQVFHGENKATIETGEPNESALSSPSPPASRMVSGLEERAGERRPFRANRVAGSWRGGPFTAAPANPLNVFTQLDIPVSHVNEVFPAIVLVQAETDLHEGTPLRPLRFSDEVQPRFLRRAIGLECIAIDARANDVFPGRRPAAVARKNVVEVQIFPVKGLATILAGILVTLKDVMAGEP